MPRRRVQPTEGMPRFTGGAVGALAYDAISSFEPSVPLPDRDPVEVPIAAFIETDLVLVFDHLTHTLSAIASLHTETPDLEGRYRIAEAAIFEALERTSRPSAAELNGTSRRPADGATAASSAGGSRRRSGRDQPRSRRVHPRGPGGQGRDRGGRGDPGRAGPPPVVRPAGRPGDRRHPRRDRALPGASAGQSRARTCSSSGRPATRWSGASPELLLQVEGDRLTTHPIAGTRPRGADAREDALLAEELQRDPKERAEHVMLVDLGRNDLGRVARPGTVTVSKYMEVERYSHVLHLVSHVEGRLRPELDALDALRSVFPAGTLSGAPKIRAMQLIAAAEGERRGLYGGAVGYLGYDGNLDTAITIRSAVLKDGQAHVHTGAGIVAGSVPEREFEETEHKAAALRRAIDLAAGVPDLPRPGDRRGRWRRSAGAGERSPGARRMILVIDNYDSFTFNLVQALQAAGAEVRVVRNDALDGAAIRELADDPESDLRGIVISPGPGDPDHAGVSVESVMDRRGARHPAARRLPRDAVDGRGVRRLDRPRADARPRRGVRGHPRRRRPAGRACRPRSWPPATTRWRWTRRRCPSSCGSPRSARSTGWSWVSATSALPLEGVQFHPGVGPDAAGSAPAGQLPAPGGRGRGVTARRRQRDRSRPPAWRSRASRPARST